MHLYQIKGLNLDPEDLYDEDLNGRQPLVDLAYLWMDKIGLSLGTSGVTYNFRNAHKFVSIDRIIALCKEKGGDVRDVRVKGPDIYGGSVRLASIADIKKFALHKLKNTGV